PPEWWEKQKGSRGIRRGQWYRLVFQFPIRQDIDFSAASIPGGKATAIVSIKEFMTKVAKVK
uniref:hypothetical protein n=1 Tax=Escherichia coli TaxID=562 RepID=UPI0021C5BB8B